MNIKTEQLTGVALNWAVAQCECVKVKLSSTGFLIYTDKNIPTGPNGREYSPSGNWAQGGPIIDRAECWPSRYFGADASRGRVYQASHGAIYRQGPSPLVAAMRCYVTLTLGDEVCIPDELTEAQS